jgi:hypothetical protein
MIGFDDDHDSLGQPAKESREDEAQVSKVRAMAEDARGLCSSLRRKMGGAAGESESRARRGAGVCNGMEEEEEYIREDMMERQELHLHCMQPTQAMTSSPPSSSKPQPTMDSMWSDRLCLSPVLSNWQAGKDRGTPERMST